MANVRTCAINTKLVLIILPTKLSPLPPLTNLPSPEPCHRANLYMDISAYFTVAYGSVCCSISTDRLCLYSW